MNNKLETRSASLRSAVGEDGTLSGTAIVFDSPSVDFGGWEEIIDPEAIELDDDLYLDYDHQSANILGRTANGTLSVEIDSEGVHFTAKPPKTTVAQDVLALVRDGYVRGCSFAFECLEDDIQRLEGRLVRIVKRAHVYALTITGIPAYPATTAEVRSRMEAAAGDTPAIMEEQQGTDAHGAEGEERSSEHPATYIGTRFGSMKLI